MLPDKIAFVDIETTGGRPLRDRVIEIGIVRVENNVEVARYSQLINPHTAIPSPIVGLTGISGDMLYGAPTFAEVKRDVLELLADCTFVAHNVRFDLSFLKHEFKREGIVFSPRHFCTVKLSRHLYPSQTHHNLDAVMAYHNIPCLNRHRAFDDANVLWQFYKKILASHPLETLVNAVKHVSKQPSLPIGLASGATDNLPECCGVYVFYGDDDIPLYVGKSINIRDRVLSHFASDQRDSKEMHLSQQVKRIETIKTAGELGALLREAQMVKHMQPLYNRRLRHSRKLLCLTKSTTPSGYDTATIETINAGELPKKTDILGFFKSQKQVKVFLDRMATEKGLCKALLGIERCKGACFGYRLSKCHGACVDKELPIKYNLRFLEAFFSSRMKRWPFEGPIVILEKDVLEDIGEAFILDQWMCVGNKPITYDQPLTVSELFSTYASDLTRDIVNTVEPPFDLDAYKIIFSYLKNPKFLSNVYVSARQTAREPSQYANSLLL